jgi:hypothetical protein
LKDIKHGVLGNVIAKIWVIEFQKRGLPHAHILLILDEASKLCIAEDYNLMVSVEILNPIHHPEAYETVISCMVHGPCGPDFFNAQCMEQCRNPNLGLTTKARVCKVVGQEGSHESHNILPEV